MSISSSHKSPNLKVALAVVASTGEYSKRQIARCQSANQYSTCQDGNI
jgi:hypothetical protein